jgi:hypothetical protein
MSAADTRKTGARIHGTVRVSLPAKVAYNPESLKKTIGSLLTHLGCPGCFSGADCVFTAERNFAIDPEGIFSHLALNPQPLPPIVAPDLTVSLAAGNRFNIDKVFSAIDTVIDRLPGGGGCLPCHSGFDISYLNEIEFLGIDENGKAQQFGGQAQFGG